MTVSPPEYRWPRAALLLLLTLITTTAFGTGFYYSTRTDVVTNLVADPAWMLLGYPGQFLTAMIDIPVTVWSTPDLLRAGLSFSLPLLLILLSHELGHFFACRRHGVACTLPYFLPAPLLLGTFGAFIRIRSRIGSRAQLFDIGAAGPVAGFLVLLPFLFFGVAQSRYSPILEIDPAIGGNLLLVPGQSPLLFGLMRLFHGEPAAGTAVDYHPFALAAWVGLFVTALNLIPMGQLDGGHILYSLSPRVYRSLRPALLVILVLLGLWWKGWWLWFGLLLLLARRHPPVIRPGERLGRTRRLLAVATLAIFALVFTPVPLSIVTVLN